MTSEKMCRLCMGRSNLIYSVMDENLIQKIAICINPTDAAFPLELCALCVLKVKDFFEFRQNCLKVQQLLEQNTAPIDEVKLPSDTNLGIKDEKPSTEKVETTQATKFEIIIDSEENDDEHFLDEVPEHQENVSIVESETIATIEELEEIPDEDEIIELVEETHETQQEFEYDLQSTEARHMDYRVDMIELNYDSNNPADVSDEIQNDEDYSETEIESNTVLKIEENEGPSCQITPLLRNTLKQYSGPKQPKPSLSEKEIYQSLLQACPTCGKSVERNRMEGHRNRHLDIRPYLCSEESCSMTFHCKISLRLHTKARHSTEKMNCDICGKVYTSKKGLYHHRKESHTEKHYACDECGLVFVTNARLNRHKVIHTDQREFKCPYCPKEFFRNNNLKVHIRSHTKEKPFSCSACDKAFGYQRLLREHISRHH
ncbi:zinc finger and SCAN domain-containing protein 31-like isoform X2 [Armigeres subalbatus]|uniref:zinc finger and SCAN domain-containing protein 31-like isoform X2 n=1 Tax=Armigeres subalbatus TaxID=124917 RepID=UPI002ED30682